MDAERARAFLLTLPYAVETEQWGHNLVFWVGDKAIGGKMFALINLDTDGSHGVASWSAGPEHFAELVELDGLYQAPYMARIHWIAAERWSVFRNAEWEAEFTAAHSLTLGKLSPKTRKMLDLPARELKRLVTERAELLANRKQAMAAKR